MPYTWSKYFLKPSLLQCGAPAESKPANKDTKTASQPDPKGVGDCGDAGDPGSGVDIDPSPWQEDMRTVGMDPSLKVVRAPNSIRIRSKENEVVRQYHYIDEFCAEVELALESQNV